MHHVNRLGNLEVVLWATMIALGIASGTAGCVHLARTSKPFIMPGDMVVVLPPGDGTVVQDYTYVASRNDGTSCHIGTAHATTAGGTAMVMGVSEDGTMVDLVWRSVARSTTMDDDCGNGANVSMSRREFLGLRMTASGKVVPPTTQVPPFQ